MAKLTELVRILTLTAFVVATLLIIDGVFRISVSDLMGQQASAQEYVNGNP